MSRRPHALPLALLAATIACDAVPPPTQPPSQPLSTQPWLPPPPQPAEPPQPAAPPARPAEAVVALTWQQRTAIAVAEMQDKEPERYKKLSKLLPNRRVGDEKQYTQTIAQDPGAAAVFLKRLLNGSDSVAVRLALVDALPATGGDWQEGVAALVAIDASPRVRKKLIETLRYVPPPHDITGLRNGFNDEDVQVRAAAARTVGFARDGIGLFQEVVSMTFDEDWDARAAACQSLGKFGHMAAWPQLLRMLGDPHPEVRLQVLIALEHLDAEATRQLPALDKLANDRQNPRLASLARRLKSGSATPSAGKASPKPPRTPKPKPAE
jgi:HEAT repeat protein